MTLHTSPVGQPDLIIPLGTYYPPGPNHPGRFVLVAKSCANEKHHGRVAESDRSTHAQSLCLCPDVNPRGTVITISLRVIARFHLALLRPLLLPCGRLFWWRFCACATTSGVRPASLLLIAGYHSKLALTSAQIFRRCSRKFLRGELNMKTIVPRGWDSLSPENSPGLR